MKKIVPAFPILLVLLLGLAAAAPAFDLTILHVNDTHSYLEATPETLSLDGARTGVLLGGWARLATAVDRVRAGGGNVALLHAGDAVQGGLYFLRYGGEPEMRLLDRLGFDAMTLGNHEFDRGTAFLAGMLRQTKVPVVDANVGAPGAPALAERLRPYVVLDYAGERVGVVGLTTADTRFTSSPGPGVTFADEAASARAAVAGLTAMGVNKIILLTHVGLARDEQLAAEVPGVDVIVGGHSHTLLGDGAKLGALGLNPAAPYPVKVKGPDGGDVPVVTAWKWARVLGRLDVTFDDKGRVTACAARPLLLAADEFQRKDAAGNRVPLAGDVLAGAERAVRASGVADVVPEQAATLAFLAPYDRGVEAMRRDVVGRAAADLPHIRVPGVTPAGLDLPHGSLLAPLVARSMLARLARTGEPADLALLNTGGVRESILRGDISVGTAYTVLPFNNTIFLLAMPGRTLRAALEYGVTRGNGAFPAVAGARYTADMTRPEGQRITRVEVLRDGAWQPLEPDQTYRVATNAYLAGGGDGYAMLKDVPDRYDTGFVDAQAFIDLVRAESPLAPPTDTGVTYIPAK
ncbi:5'-nucleotidase C-terminal domain-containing protein [Pseudodesulfovibrio sp.]|uniref:bifunctional metallophosphatase/5'-nucleotidase n=1 Tax=Pseudodesulfovibrio sp. TaxID=2035812 RepID=UPI00262D2850|nr:5'-nucleotidase C-terminal domain-containing protein [Pseudodesulfovibrio sp.]MDD3313453.1 5'-nucleotidase C-terminal domain-containing protein [Pseudodesulfovibrio sp.]